MSVEQIHQLFLRQEQTEGAYLDPRSSTYATVLALDAQNPEPEYANFPRNPARTSAAEPKSTIGRRVWKWPFGVDLRADGASGGVPNEPEWTLPLRSSGFRRIRLRSQACTLMTGTFQHMEKLTHGSGADLRIVGSPNGKSEIIYYIEGTLAEPASGVVTGATSSATCTLSGSPADHGYMLVPTTHIVHFATRSAAWTAGTPVQGETIVGATSGAKGRLLFPLGELAAASGVVYYEPIVGAFLSGEVITGQKSSATTTLSSNGFSIDNYTLSIGSFLDGTDVVARGARANPKFKLVAGEPSRIDFEFMGAQQLVTDGAIVASYAPDSTVGLIFESANMTMQGSGSAVSIDLLNFELDLGLSLEPWDSENSSEGLKSFRGTTRAPVGTMDPEHLPPGANDLFQDWKDGDLQDIRIRMGISESAIGSHADGTGLWIDVPKAQLIEMPFGGRAGRRTNQINFACREVTDVLGLDQEIRIFVI